jgi:hypothetical protein
MRRNVSLLLVLAFLTASLIFAAKPISATTAVENSWTSKALMHEPRGGLGVAMVNGKIYAIGGSNQSGPYPANIHGGFVGTNEEYDPETNTWTYKSPMPTPRSDFAIAVYNNKIYCMGGTVGTETVQVTFSRFVTSAVNEVYDPATDTWETKASLPNAGMFMQAVVVDNKIYVIDGPLNEVYDAENDSWTTKNPTPLPAEDYGAGGPNDYPLFLLNNKLYIVGQFSSRFIEYDLLEDTWSDGSMLPDYAFYSVAGGMTSGNNAPRRFYLFFGIRGSVPSAATQAYDPVNNVWTPGKHIPTVRIHPGIAIVDDKLYVIGGYAMFHSGHVKASNLNEQYTPIGYGTVPPKVAVVSPVIGNNTSGNVSLAFRVNKPASWMGYSLDGQDNITVTGNITLSGLASGLHNITIYARDEFNNMGASETITFTVAEPFPIALVATVSIAAVAVVSIGLLLYFKKRKR